MLLLDTNVISEMRKLEAGRADPVFAAWARSVDSADLYLSVISVQELETGVLLLERRDQRQSEVLRVWLSQRVLPAFERRILPVTQPIALAAARLHVPVTRPYRDSLIAATAVVHGMTVVTRNVADFRNCGLHPFNPFTGQ